MIARKILAIDPGNHLGHASFLDGELRACGIGTPETPFPVDADTTLVIERPEVYPGMSSGIANDLITLSIVVGRVIERVKPANLVTPMPKQWKGQVPKSVTESRARRALSPSELATLDRALSTVAKRYQNNVVDAVALGLWHLGRYR